MAGGKETPRQKMIGMMYLVLTALLALNVSKQIINAFITLNEKLDNSVSIIHNKSQDAYAGFDRKRAALNALGGNTKTIDYWEKKAFELKKETASIVGYLLGECNDMIETSEGTDWVAERDKDGNIVSLKPLKDIKGMDNYDIPTNLFVGGNPQKPNQRGLDIRKKIHEYRDNVLELMGTYQEGIKKWVFKSPENISGLKEAFKTANPKDTAKLGQYYKSLTIPEKLDAGYENGEQPWVSVTFDHAPIVAAAAMFTSLKLDIKNSETMACEYMLDKVNAPIFDFNKIEPMAIAGSGYVNIGDSMGVRIMVAAYDSNEVSKIRYGVDADTASPENWLETSGAIGLPSTSPGAHKVKGQIGVKEKGELAWKNWEYSYTVGQPMGVVALPEMRVLYWGYNNVVEGTASGFPPDKVSLNGNGCRIVREDNKYIAKVERGTRTARISVNGRKDDGSSVSLGSFEFDCKPLPDAKIFFNRYVNGDQVPYVVARSQKNVRLDFDQSVNLRKVNFEILGGEVIISGINGKGTIKPGGSFDQSTINNLAQSRGKTVTVIVRYRDPGNIVKIISSTYTVN